MSAPARQRGGLSGRDGFILVAVLGVMALMAGLVGGTALLVRAAFEGARTSSDQLALDGLARAGLDLAAHQLYTLRLPMGLINGQDVRLDSGTVRLSVTDEAGRIDLNGAPPELLAAACTLAGCASLKPEAFAQAVVAWRDRYDRPAAARQGEPAMRRKDGFGSVEELSRLPGLSARDLAALRPLLTVGNPSGKVNLMSAPPAVVLALPDMTPALAAQVIALRREPGPKIAERIMGMLPRQQSFVTTQSGPSYRVRVEAHRGGGAARVSEAMITRAPAKLAPFFIVGWSE